MATFVLVHGAWGGAHTWRGVRPRLWAAGHPVFTPSLTGIGERAHLTAPHVDLSVHIDDVVNTVLYEGLDDLVLVGFSYGGMVVTGALAHIADRVRELVYLDAFVPADGQSAMALFGVEGADVTTLDAVWLVPPIDRTYDDPAEAEFANARRTPQPIRTLTEPVRLLQPLETYAFGRTYVKALGDPRPEVGSDVFWSAAERYRDHPDWRYLEHPSNHMIPQNDPEGLATILLSFA
jgi:pimeloyl-ACP methyl ester carboxylesterase